jgi:ABC-type molybdate transport system substrate-binding protein
LKEKIQNFFYYYKFHVLAVLFVILVIAVLVRDKSQGQQVNLVIADETSEMNLETAGNMLRDFEKTAGLKDGEAGFYYKTMFLDQKNFQDVNLEIAGVSDYNTSLTNGEIDLIINTVDQIGEPSVFLDEIFSAEELDGMQSFLYLTDERPAGLVFDKCPKAKEYFGDDYPSPNHYILQVADGSKDKQMVKEFIKYLITE